MIVIKNDIKRWIILASVALIVVAVAISIILVSCKDDKDGYEVVSDTSSASSLTQSEIDDIISWWEGAQIEEAGDTSIQSN